MKESELVRMLDADWQRACAVLMMQVCIEEEDYEGAMNCQFEFLYYDDEFKPLFRKHHNAYWELRLGMHGVKLTGMP